MTMVMMIVVAVAVVSTPLHCYDVSITNNTDKHTCKNNFRDYKKERKSKNEIISYIQSSFNGNAYNKQKYPSGSMQNTNDTYLVLDKLFQLCPKK